MDNKMKVAVMEDIRKMNIIKRDIPKVADNEVLVKLEYVGICGSDLHYFEKGKIGNFVVETPFVLGHEAAGEVIEVGKDVTNLVLGDRVALEPGKTCGKCEFCKKGKYNLCSDVKFFATPPIDGVFSEYVSHEAELCFKLPDNVSTLEGAMIEPLSVGFHAAIQGNAKMGQKAVVMGAGCIGLSSVMALKALGVNDVYVVDIVDKRLDKALELGATKVINAKNEEPVSKVMEFTNNQGSDLVIETAGAEVTTRNAIEMAKKGSVITLVGYSLDGNINMNIGLALDKELTFKTVFRYRHIYPLAIEAVSNRKVDLKNLVTDIFEFDDIQKAMDMSIENKDEIVKAAIKVSD